MLSGTVVAIDAFKKSLEAEERARKEKFPLDNQRRSSTEVNSSKPIFSTNIQYDSLRGSDKNDLCSNEHDLKNDHSSISLSVSTLVANNKNRFLPNEYDPKTKQPFIINVAQSFLLNQDAQRFLV